MYAHLVLVCKRTLTQVGKEFRRFDSAADLYTIRILNEVKDTIVVTGNFATQSKFNAMYSLTKGRKTFNMTAKSKGKAPKGGYKFQVTVVCNNNETGAEIGKTTFNCFAEVKSGKLSDTRIEEAFYKYLEAAKPEQVAKLLGYTSDKGLKHVPKWIKWVSATKGDILALVNRTELRKEKAAAKPKVEKKRKQPKADVVTKDSPAKEDKADSTQLERLLVLAEKQQTTIEKLTTLIAA